MFKSQLKDKSYFFKRVSSFFRRRIFVGVLGFHLAVSWAAIPDASTLVLNMAEESEPAAVPAAPAPEAKNNDFSYRTSFGRCPARPVGMLALGLVKSFEQGKSLRQVKKFIVQEKLASKYFISWYKIEFDPLKKSLQLNFDCPTPLMKVQIYKDGQNSYDAILVDNGELYDPAYETILRTEQKLKRDLPFLALPVGEIDSKTQHQVTNLIKNLDQSLRQRLAEVILAESGDLTIILAIHQRPTSVFVGQEEWEQKAKKLQKIVAYLESQQRIPSIINLMNLKKVVVKFNNKS